MYKENERKIIEKLNKAYPFITNLEIAQDEYSRYDAYNKQYIIEVKDRVKDYPSLLIEFDKYSFNKEYSTIKGLYFWYVVKTDKIYVFDISGLNSYGYNYQWKWKKMPKTTEFDRSEFIWKFVGYIDKNMAIGTIE